MDNKIICKNTQFFDFFSIFPAEIISCRIGLNSNLVRIDCFFGLRVGYVRIY